MANRENLLFYPSEQDQRRITEQKPRQRADNPDVILNLTPRQFAMAVESSRNAQRDARRMRNIIKSEARINAN